MPPDLKLANADDKNSYDQAMEKLVSHVSELIKFYKDYEFFYNQYKHGLSVAMRPFGNIFTEEQVNKDKKDEMPPYLTVYDNMNLEAGFKKGTAKTNHGIMMPGFTDNVRPFISQLSAENNYIRLVYPSDYPNFNIDLLVRIAKMTSYCIQLFIYNYSWKIKPEGSIYKFQLPDDFMTRNVVSCSYSNTED